MKTHVTCFAAAAALAALSGCTLIPHYERPPAPIDAAYPQGEAYPRPDAATPGPLAAQVGWRDFFADYQPRTEPPA